MHGGTELQCVVACAMITNNPSVHFEFSEPLCAPGSDKSHGT